MYAIPLLSRSHASSGLSQRSLVSAPKHKRNIDPAVRFVKRQAGSGSISALTKRRSSCYTKTLINNCVRYLRPSCSSFFCRLISTGLRATSICRSAAGGKVITPIGSADDHAQSAAVQSDGKIVAAGTIFNGANNDFAGARYSPNGNYVLSSREWDGTAANVGAVTFARTATPTVTPTGTPCSYRVLIVYTDENGGPPTQLRTALLAEPGIRAVDLFDAGFATPTLALLQQYDIVLPFLVLKFADATAMGNVLADYIDAGGVVVGHTYLYGEDVPIEGRFVTGGYSPYTISVVNNFTNRTLGTFDPLHPLMQGVTALASNRNNDATLAPGASLVASWNTGAPLIAVKTVGGHTSVGVTAYVGNNGAWSGNFARIIVNAGRWLRPASCGAAFDFDGDAKTDISIFRPAPGE